MPQRSLLSFFNANTSNEDPAEILTPKQDNEPKRRKRIVQESDESDENCSPNGKEVKMDCMKSEKLDDDKISVNGSARNNNESALQSSTVLSTTTQFNETKSEQFIDSGTLSISSSDYDPSKLSYSPLKDATWRGGSDVPYICLAKTFEYIESTSGRLKMIEALGNLFRSVGLLSPGNLATCIYLSLNQLGPAYEGSELGVGETILLKALGMTTGVGLEHLKSSFKRTGDLGTLAENIRSRQKTMFTPKPLTLPMVFNKLKEIASMTGNASQGKKVEKICSLLVACRESEAKYLIRSLSGKLRIGLAEQSVLTALGQAVALTPFHSIAAVEGQESANRLLDASVGVSQEKWKARVEACVANVKKAYCVCPNYDKLVHGLLTDGADGLAHHCYISPGVPVKPMLAHPTHGVMDVLKRFDESDFTCEYKYDGERAQIHMLDPTTCHVYSRNQENNTSKYPDIRSLMPRLFQSASLSETVLTHLTAKSMESMTDQKTIQSFILDSEVVAWDRQAGHILPFQVLSTRKRKDVDETAVKVQVCVYAFDLIYLNGVSLIEKPLRVRREILRSVFPQIDGEFMLATSLDSSDTEEIASFLDGSIKGNCEGLMVKTLDRNSTYEIAKRSHNWLKLKKDYLDNVGDTLDLVVIGGFHGSGKRAGRYGGFLLACYDTESEEYQTICKIGTGMKDEDLVQFSEFFKDQVIPSAKPYYQYDNVLVPDHWFEPVQVWEVKAADLSISPAHKAAAGLADPEKGISLRFPRFLRVRDDKKPEDGTSAQQVYEMYKSQEQIKVRDANKTNTTEDDIY